MSAVAGMAADEGARPDERWMVRRGRLLPQGLAARPGQHYYCCFIADLPMR